MEQPTVFVSHAHEDAPFVGLLVRLLRFHGVNTWFSESKLQGGDLFRQEISDALANTDCMIVVVSHAAVRSKWIHFEISAFRATHPKNKIIPLRLDTSEPTSVFDGLGDYQYISFTESLSEGFEELLSVFGRQFLVAEPAKKERRTAERRMAGRRGTSHDRRRTPLLVRLRKGFWLAFYRATELEKHDRFPVNLHNIERVVKSLRDEAERYSYVDRITGAFRPPEQALMAAGTRVWERMRDWQLTTVNVVEAVAEQIYEDYEVSAHERRAMGRRGGERRAAAGAGGD